MVDPKQKEIAELLAWVFLLGDRPVFLAFTRAEEEEDIQEILERICLN